MIIDIIMSMTISDIIVIINCIVIVIIMIVIINCIIVICIMSLPGASWT